MTSCQAADTNAKPRSRSPPESRSLTSSCKPVLMSSFHWHEPWYSAVCGLSMDQFDILYLDDSSADMFDIEAHVAELVAKMEAHGAPIPVLSATDSMMIVHAMAKDALKDDPRFASLTGASMCATILCDHKLLTRALVPGCGSIRYKGVRSTDEVVPAIDGVESDMILKPIAALGSVNVHKVRAGQPSPFYGLRDESAGALHKATFLHVERFGATVPDAKECIGLLEEYVSPHVKKVSVDGAFCRGVVIPWCISDNIYRQDSPEVFEALETPSSLCSPAEQAKIWEVFSEVAHGLHSLSDGDFDCQFICIEMFVFDSTRVEVMEVNIRISANQLPVFHRVMDGGCPLLAQVQMQSPNPTVKAPVPNGLFAICLYRPALETAGPLRQSSKERHGFEATYYRRIKTLAHVYGYGATPQEARHAAEHLYAELEAEVAQLSKQESMVSGHTAALRAASVSGA
mmetsp:Transcript_30907/g.57876  ORF Transcript_30907/g.57876 Transcript_30907/m.57876 type:complete len:458 (+) Transcript_30907:58-1431(+)